jgi:pSer/pThr/pTyr-binding forkhead associated (FHA) protein
MSARVPSGADAWLVDERWFKAYPLASRTTIGRSANSTIILRDPAVSRVHAEVRREALGFVLRARGSAGTKVNGVRVGGECALQEGDVIEIAYSNLRFTQRAPTGEMFVVSRDPVANVDSLDVPTRATLHAMHPITLAARWRRWWHYLAIAALVLLVIAICAGTSGIT